MHFPANQDFPSRPPSPSLCPPPPPPSPSVMPPTPIAQNTVNLALTYITPPSQITQPLPPFILSKALLQRHHFLSISYDDPVDYLSWPSDTSSKAIDLLELLPTPVEDFAPASYPTHYTTDGEYVYAHIGVFPPSREGVRLVFQWDDPDGWKFHDLKTMPFPEGSSPSLLQALTASAAATEPDPEPSYGAQITHDSYTYERDDASGSDDDDDDYWNAYGAADSDGGSPRQHSLPLKDDGGDSEDAYWARYASVHGTADSTIPSPREQKRRPDQSGGTHDPHPLSGPTGEHDRHLISIVPMDKQAPASPTTLARLLSDVSPRRSPAPCFDAEDMPEFLSEGTDAFQDFSGYGDYPVRGAFSGEVVGQEAGPEFGAMGLGLRGIGVGLGGGEDRELSPPCEGSDDSDETPSPPNEDDRARNGVGALGLTQDLADSLRQDEPMSLLGTQTEQGERFSAEDGALAQGALRESVKGLYSLWRSTARTSAGVSEKEAFMRVVADAIGHSA
ncbi:hypothetical protein EIP86_002861 [Pleurotus ostreatoroseus]|nr:hypothetical protein EIP86_002861 [Pleurotus ostreatoroseus]